MQTRSRISNNTRVTHRSRIYQLKFNFFILNDSIDNNLSLVFTFDIRNRYYKQLCIMFGICGIFFYFGTYLHLVKKNKYRFLVIGILIRT